MARRQTQLIPRSIHKYVTRVSKDSQQRHGVKYDEIKYVTRVSEASQQRHGVKYDEITGINLEH